MIILNIILENAETANEISHFLIQRKYALSIYLDKKIKLVNEAETNIIKLFLSPKHYFFQI